MTGAARLVAGTVLLAVLGLTASLSPPPNRVTDRDVYEATASAGIVPDCADIHCFRVLVPWVLGWVPGPSSAKWKAYAVVANVVGALAVFQLALTLGLSRRAAGIALAISAFGFGSLYTLHDPYTADPLMYALGPTILNEVLSARVAWAAALGAVGVLAKEFAAAPLFLGAAVTALERRSPLAYRALAAGNLAVIMWLVLQLTLMLRFNYSYGDNPSTHLLSGGYLRPWLAAQSTRGALTAMFNEFGALYILAPVGLWRAPVSLRRLALVAAPVAVVFAYVQQPDRAMWNFHFIVSPLAALVLERVPTAIAALTLATFAIGNLRVGAQLSAVPAAGFAIFCSVVLAGVSVWYCLRETAGPSPRIPELHLVSD